MNFTLSTKPFADALNLGVIPANVSKYFRLSCLAQLTASKHELRVNLQASSLCTEILLKGSGDSEEEKTVFVDCVILKQLVGTLDSSTVTIEYIDGGIVLHSGSSKFTLPQLAESGEGELARPSLPAPGADKFKLDLADWKFIKDYQMYAVALSFVNPVYKNVWVGESGDVIVGDLDNSLFTFSKKSKLGNTCLLTDTIINLFNSFPEGSEITLLPEKRSYRVDVKTDGFEYATEFSPKYEGEDGEGEYGAEVILTSVGKDENNCFKVAVAPIAKFLSQSELLSSGTDNKVEFELTGTKLTIKDENIDTKVGVTGNCQDFKVSLNASLFKPVISHLDAEEVYMCPVIADEEIGGLVIWSDNLSVALGAMDEQ